MFFNKWQISHKLIFSHLVSVFFLKVMPLEPPSAGQSCAHLWSLMRDTVRCMDFTTTHVRARTHGRCSSQIIKPRSRASGQPNVQGHGPWGWWWGAEESPYWWFYVEANFTQNGPKCIKATWRWLFILVYLFWVHSVVLNLMMGMKQTCCPGLCGPLKGENPIWSGLIWSQPHHQATYMDSGLTFEKSMTLF